ncbi:MAG: ATP-binding cassette domain-containing protein [Sneathiella sp.]|nr:ATP-binding cassette domain-containing protein [Sneathiella sp.]
MALTENEAAAGIQISDLSYAYGAKKALDNLSFTVKTGRFTALLGPNGAGKSTLYHLLTRIMKLQAGQIEIFGSDLNRSSLTAMTSMGIVFQQQTLDLDLTVRQNLRYFAALHGLPHRGLEDQISNRLSSLDMLERADEKVRALNGGHRRRVEIARALLHEPKLLLLDEPTVGLDVPSRKAIVSYIHKQCQERGLTALWATHLVDEVLPEDDLILLHRGSIRAQGCVADLLKKHNCDDVAALFETLVLAEPVE